MQPSPNGRRVGIRIVTFEACSGFTHVTAHRIAQSPKATFVTRLQPCRLPSRAARQLPDQSTILRVESSSTDDSRLRGARPLGDICVCVREVLAAANVGFSCLANLISLSSKMHWSIRNRGSRVGARAAIGAYCGRGGRALAFATWRPHEI